MSPRQRSPAMGTAKRAHCASGIILLIVAGCAVPDYLGLNLLHTTSAGGDRLVVGSLESVSQSTQGSLRQLGLAVAATDEAGAVRLVCTTRSNQRFDLVLTRVQNDQGEQTRVRLEW